MHDLDTSNAIADLAYKQCKDNNLLWLGYKMGFGYTWKECLDMKNICSLCGTNRLMTFHHLIPKKCQKNKWFKKNFQKSDMKERGIWVCRRCHSFIHKQFSEKVLGRELNTLDKLLSNEKIILFIKWAKKQH